MMGQVNFLWSWKWLYRNYIATEVGERIAGTSGLCHSLICYFIRKKELSIETMIVVYKRPFRITVIHTEVTDIKYLRDVLSIYPWKVTSIYKIRNNTIREELESTQL